MLEAASRSAGSLSATMLARVHVCQEIVIPAGNQKVSGDLLVDDTVLDMAEGNLRAFVGTIG
ncbi:MAG: hypothetical protein ACOH2J_14015 [Allorhizobium sp.]